MAYTHVTNWERMLIAEWTQAGVPASAVAKLLHRPRCTIGRELRRNAGVNGYNGQEASTLASRRALRSGARGYTDAMRAEVETRLMGGQTPEMIQGRVRLEGRAMACKETIYGHVYADANGGGDLWTWLTRAKRKRRRRCPRGSRDGRGQLRNRRGIETRPAEVELRQRVGDWEGDLVTGAHGTGHLVTLVDRSIRFTLIGYVPSKNAQEVERIVNALMGRLPRSARHSLTLDNGKEFAGHESIAKVCEIDVYFARPYHAWERGTNENVNGLVRRLFPKGTSFLHFGADELELLDTFLNDRPRKCLGWRTPRECYQERLPAA